MCYTIDVPRGENELVIVAVDTSNNTSTYGPKIIAGFTKPTIEIKQTEDRKKLAIVVQHEKGIKRIEYTLYNGDPNDPNTESKDYMKTDQGETRVEFEQELYVGYNRIILKVTSEEETTETFDGECNYIPDTQRNSYTQ